MKTWGNDWLNKWEQDHEPETPRSITTARPIRERIVNELANVLSPVWAERLADRIMKIVDGT
jgi:hypothetical protein